MEAIDNASSDTTHATFMATSHDHYVQNITSAIAQCFLLYRYYELSRSIIFTALVIVMIVAQLAAGFTIGIDYLVHPRFGSPVAAMARPIWFCVAAAIDLFIPILLIYELRQIKTTHSSMQSFIRRLIVNFASSGCVVALAEILVLCLFWTGPHLILLGCNVVAPCYGITVLVNLFVCQSKTHSAATGMQTKTVNTDSAQLYGSTPRRLTDIQESSEGTGNQSTDYNSPWTEKS